MTTLSISGPDRELHCADVRDDLAAYALRALDDGDQRLFERHLASCAGCTAALREFVGVVDALNASVPPSQPPPALKARLLAGVGGAAEISPPIPVTAPIGAVPIPIRHYRRRPWMTLLAAAALLVMIAGVVAVVMQRTAGDDAKPSPDYVNLQAYLAAGGVAIPLTGRQSSIYDTSAVTGRVVTLGAKSPILEVNGCPPSGTMLDYRVWVAKAGQRTPVGRLNVDSGGWGIVTLDVPSSLVSYDQVGVTVLSNGSDRQDVLVGSIAPQQT